VPSLEEAPAALPAHLASWPSTFAMAGGGHGGSQQGAACRARRDHSPARPLPRRRGAARRADLTTPDSVVPVDELLARLAESPTSSAPRCFLACDQDVCMPPARVAGHGELRATIGRPAHERFTDEQVGELLAAAQPRRHRGRRRACRPAATSRRPVASPASSSPRSRARAPPRGWRGTRRASANRSARRSERAGQRRAGGSRGGRGARRCCSRGPSRRRTPRTQQAP
jgi:hypothetical protein